MKDAHGSTILACAVDLEYANGWRETRIVRPGADFVMPFGGRVVGMEFFNPELEPEGPTMTPGVRKIQDSLNRSLNLQGEVLEWCPLKRISLWDRVFLMFWRVSGGLWRCR